MKTMTSLEKQINELAEYEAAEIADNFLEKLGICVCLENDVEDDDPYFPCHYYKLRDNHGMEVLCHAEDMVLFDKFDTGNILLEAIFSNITAFVFYASKMKNPFLGCRSLEEAMIRMDLAGEDGNA